MHVCVCVCVCVCVKCSQDEWILTGFIIETSGCDTGTGTEQVGRYDGGSDGYSSAYKYVHVVRIIQQ